MNATHFLMVPNNTATLTPTVVLSIAIGQGATSAAIRALLSSFLRLHAA